MSLQKSHFIKIILLVSYLIFSNLSMAQNNIEFAEELKAANRSIYHDAPKAILISKEIYENAKSTGTKITALITLVNAYNANNQTEKALVYASKTLELADKSDNIQYRIWALGLLGEQYQLSHLHTVSREYLDKAEELLKDSDLSKVDVAVSRGNIFAIKANGYKDEIDCEYAIKNYDLAIASYLSIGEESAAKNNLALVYLEKGNCLLDLQDLAGAENNFLKSLSISKEKKLKDYEQSASLGLATIASKRGRHKVSVDSLRALIKEIDSIRHPKLKQGVYSLLAENYLAMDSLDSYQFFENKRLQILMEINDQEKNQFQQVITFVDQDSLALKNSVKIEEMIFLLLALIIFSILGFEIKKRLKK